MRKLPLILMLLLAGCSGSTKEKGPPTEKEIIDKGEQALIDMKYDTERKRLKVVEVAVMGYYYKHGKFPKDIIQLTQGDPAYLEAEQAVDQWDHFYTLEASKLNKSGIPRISSAGAPGKNKTISNW